MSQHNITLNSPIAGSVQVTLGFDPRLREVFVNFMNDKVSFMSPPAAAIEDVPLIVREHLNVEVPQSMLQAVVQDQLDFENGASDVGRRIRQYECDGSLVSAITY